MDNKTLIQELINRDEKSLSVLIDMYGNLIYKTSYTILESKELSEEVLNTVLLKVWDNIDSFDGNEDTFKNWIFTIAKRTSIDTLRKETKYLNKSTELNDFIKSSDNVESIVISKEEKIEVNNVLEKLDNDEKKIITDRYFNDILVKDIAKDIGITPKATSLRISRIKNKLSRFFKGEYDNEK